MPGFMGLRGLNQKRSHTTERLCAERKTSKEELERRAAAKTQIILRNQDDDMSPQTGGMPVDGGRDDRNDANFIEKIMSKKIAALGFDDNLLTVQNVFSIVKIQHLPIVDHDRNIIGIISEKDFLRIVSPFLGTVNEQTRDKEIMTRRAGMIMTRNPVCAEIGTTIPDAIQLMDGNSISCLPIVERGGKRLLGMVTWKDIVRAQYPTSFSA